MEDIIILKTIQCPFINLSDQIHGSWKIYARGRQWKCNTSDGKEGEGLLSVRNRYIIAYMAEGFKFKLI